jgi:hypothetical protein
LLFLKKMKISIQHESFETNSAAFLQSACLNPSFLLDMCKQNFQLQTRYNQLPENATSWTYDPQLLETEDKRRCIGVISMPSSSCMSTRELSKWDLLTSQLSSQHTVYSRTGEGPRLHFTLMQLASFGHLECKLTHLKEQLSVVDHYEKTLPTTTNWKEDGEWILFDRVHCFPNAICLLGYPSWKLLEWRSQVRKQYENYKDFMEPEHHHQLVHTTLIRFNSPISLEEVTSYVDKITAFLPLKLGLTKPRVQLGSWKMTIDDMAQFL